MDLIEEALSTMIFSRNTPWDFMEVTLSADDLAVLGEIDGRKRLGCIARKLGRPIQDIMVNINELGRLKLIKHDEVPIIKTYDIRPPSTKVDRHTGDKKDKGSERLYRGVKF